MSVTIRPFRSGGWEIDIVLTLPNGEKIRERRKAPVESKSAAKRWAQERERHLLQHGRLPRRGDKGKPEEKKKEAPTFAEFLPRYFDHVKANRQKPTTQRAKRETCANHLIPVLGHLRLDEITPEHVQQLKLRLADRSPKTLNNTLAIYNTIVKLAAEWGVIATPVTAKWVKWTQPSMPFYDFDEYDRLLAAARRLGPQHELVVLLAGDAGLRLGEIRALRWTSIDFGNGLLTVERSFSMDEIVTPKSDKIRTVPMTERLREALQKHREDHEYTNVLVSERGTPPYPDRIRKWLNAAQREAKVLEKGPHTLRHTFCSHLAMTGAHVLEIKTLAGHAELETTQRYMHLTPRALRGAVNRLEGAAARRFGDAVATESGRPADPQ
jgi:integrase